MLTVSWELLTTVVTRVAPSKTTTEEETKRLPVAVRQKLGGNLRSPSLLERSSRE